jgi:acetylornithine/succinyldiaminopimelate/putrescine aminotransferase
MINSDVAAVIVEPIQGVAGAFDLSEEFLRTIRDACNDHSALMIVDEVQSGMGRSGEYFAIQNFNIEPDIMTAAKSLGGGLPCSVIFISNLLDETIKKGDLGSTFGGNPVICSAIEFVIQYIKEKNLLNNVIEREKEIRDLCITGPVNGIQGKGLLLGLITDQPAHEIQKKLLKKNILTGLSSDPSVLRLLPPLVLQSKHIEKLSQSLTEI